MAKPRCDAPMYVSRAIWKQQVHSFSTQRQLPEFEFTSCEESRPQFINDPSEG